VGVVGGQQRPQGCVGGALGPMARGIVDADNWPPRHSRRCARRQIDDVGKQPGRFAAKHGLDVALSTFVTFASQHDHLVGLQPHVASGAQIFDQPHIGYQQRARGCVVVQCRPLG
jgi:hypothetical protein